MFRKTLVVVGALAAGTVVSDGSALASWHHHGFHHHHHYERWTSSFHHRHFRFAAHRHFHSWHHHFAYGSSRLHALRSYASYRRAAAQQAYAGSYGGADAAPASTYTAPAFTAPVSTGGYVQTGSASYYGGGGRTAAGGHVGFATCAHRSLPFGTRVLVTNLNNLRQTVLTVNDRGPFVHGRLLDVSRGAAGVLGMIGSGVARIRMEVVGRAG